MSERLQFSRTLQGIEPVYRSFTPTWTNYTRGNGTSTARYLRIGKWITVFVRETLGSTSSMGTAPIMDLPFAAASTASISPASVQILDHATAFYLGQIFLDSTTTAIIRVINSAGTYAVEAAPTATVPMTWTINDHLQFTITYELA